MSNSSEKMSEDQIDAIWIAYHGVREIGADVLAFDLGAMVGWAHVSKDAELVVSGWYNTVRRGESEGMARLRFKRMLHDMIETVHPTAVWYEDPRGRFRGQGGKNIVRQIGILEAELTELGVPYGSVHQSELKKFATGRGNASKQEMRDALAEKLSQQ